MITALCVLTLGMHCPAKIVKAAVTVSEPTCPVGMQPVGTVTALDPAFQKAQVTVTYVAVNDGKGTAIACVSEMPERSNSAVNSNVPAPKQ